MYILEGRGHDMAKKSALIAGASGLVGGELLRIMLNGQRYEKVFSISRRPLGIDHPKLIEIVCDFDRLEQVLDRFDAEDVFCCLGTTIKKAKTKQNMYRIDVEYPLAIAKMAKDRGAEHFLLVSSMNANARSFFFYPRIKGILEAKLQAIPFRSISIFRPSLLLGNRQEFRLGERIAIRLFRSLSRLMKDSQKSRLAVEAKTVAMAMYNAACQEKAGVSFYAADAIEQLAK